MDRKQEAMANFRQGYNCAQALSMAFEDLTGIDHSTLMKMTSSMGGGMGRLREVCGAVSSMFLLAGICFGYDGPETGDVKMNHYARIQELAARFKKEWGTINCAALLDRPAGPEDPRPEARTIEYYNGRPCMAIIGTAAEILQDMLREEGKLPEGEESRE